MRRLAGLDTRKTEEKLDTIGTGSQVALEGLMGQIAEQLNQVASEGLKAENAEQLNQVASEGLKAENAEQTYYVRLKGLEGAGGEIENPLYGRRMECE